MFLSIIVYSFIVLSLYYGFQISVGVGSTNTLSARKESQYFLRTVFAYVVFAFFSGVRWDVGVDHLAYYSEYERLTHNLDILRPDMEVGFVGLMKLLANCGMPFYVFFGLIAFLQLFFACKYFTNCKYLIPYFVILLMTGGEYFSWMNGIRQQLVTTFFMFLAPFVIFKRKGILYILLCICASYFHKSAILLLPLYLFSYANLNKIYMNKTIQLIVFIIALILSSMSLWQNSLGIVDEVFAFIGYDERYNSEVLASLSTRKVVFGPRRIIFLLIDIILILFSDKLRKAFPTKEFGYAYMLFIIFYITQPLFMDSQIFSRIVAYFSIYRIVVASYLLFYLLKLKPTNRNVVIGYSILFLFFMHLFIQIYADAGGHTDCIRYQFCMSYV